MILRYIGDGRSKDTPNMKFLTYKVIPYLESLFLRSIGSILADKAGKGLKFASRVLIVLFSLLLIPSCSDDDNNSGSSADHGDTRSTASALTLNSPISGNVETEDDVDYFRIEVTQSGTLTVYTTGNLDTVGTLEGSSGTQLEKDNNGGSGNNFRIERSVSSGTYYVKVEGFGSDDTGSYRLHADFTTVVSFDDHGNTPSAATNLSLDSSISGSIEMGSDIDYFRIEVTQSGTLTVYTTGNLNTFGYLEDSSGTELETDDQGGSGDNFRIEQPVSGGTYYIAVDGRNPSDTGSYRLHAEFTADSGGNVQVSFADRGR